MDRSAKAYIAAAKRTAIGRFGGSLAGLKISSAAASVARAVLEEASLPAEKVDEVIFGQVLQAGLGQNPARQVSLGAGIPESVPAYTVNKVCTSAMKAISLAGQSICMGQADVILAGGMESMSNAPYYLEKARFGMRMGDSACVDGMVRDGLWDVFNDYHMGVTAENLVARYQLTRQEQDQFSLESHQKACQAQQEKRFSDEIVPIEIKQKKKTIVFDQDECIRADASIEGLSQLKPVFQKDGSVTAGNASGISDGAAAVVVVSERAVKEYHLTPLARIVDTSSAGVSPSEMGLGLVEASRKVLEKSGFGLDKIDLFEINEAFAAVSLAAQRELGYDRTKVNVNGGAIALGHPIGMSGARIVVTLIHEMRRQGVRYGLASLCAGGGMGMAMILERVY